MKSFCALTLQAILACVCVSVSANAQTTTQTPVFNTGQAAHLVIGQQNFTNGNYGASNMLLGSPSGIAYANGVLWVVDSNRLGATPDNNRILRYSDVSSYPSLTDLPDVPGSTCGVCRGTASLVLGQPDFNTFTSSLSASGLRNPTGIATDGTVLVVADTDNNRVLIWLHLPTVNGQPADVVLGQQNFTSNAAVLPSQTSLRAPSGVWINNGKLFVADTYDDRVLIYNKIPTSNGAAADLVLGQTSFTAFVQPDLTQISGVATAVNMQTPVSVTTDGTRLFVADLAENRVMVWKSIPTTNGTPCDYVIGQPDFVSAATNNSFTINSTAVDADSNPTDVTPVLCPSNGSDTVTGTLLYPTRCAKTLSFPRFAYSDGTRLFIADGGNDRVMIFNSFPTANGAAADIILGQPDEFSDNTGDNPDGTNAFENPSAIAYDGTNLYITDTYNRRVMVHTPGIPNVPLNGVNNAASLAIYAVGTITFSGTITANNTVTIKIGCTGGPPDCIVSTVSYVHTVVTADTLTTIIQDLVKKINATDTNVTATYDSTDTEIVLTAKFPGIPGGNVTYSVTSSSGATILGSAAGTTLNIYLENPAQIAPGTLIQIIGNNICDSTGSADFSQTYLPFTMNNCVVYMDGVKAALLYVSSTQINAEMPIEFSDRSSTSMYVRTVHADGSVTATTPIAITVVPQNPGLFALPGNDPRPGIVYHASAQAFDIIDLNGLAQTGDTATIQIGPNATTYNSGNINVVTATNSVTGVGTAWTSAMVGGDIVISGGLYTIAAVNSATSITLTSNYLGVTGNGFTHVILYGGANYSYTETATDTITTVTTNLVNIINSAPDPYVYAVQSNEYNRIILYAYVTGPAGEGINVGEQATTNVVANFDVGAQISVTVYNPSTCCDHPANLPVTEQNPAIPGEALYTFATGIGPTNPANIPSGFVYRGGNDNPPAVFVDSILVQGLVATAMNVALVPDTVGIYYVEFALNPSLGTDALSQMTIAQQLFVSNVVTFPIVIPGTTIEPPTVTSVTPATGPLSGGNTVTIIGTNLLSAQTVTFGGVAASSFIVNSSTDITATVPVSTGVGPVSVIITTLVGSNTANTLYTYVSVPTFTSISPTSGPIAGGTKATITGSGFTGATSVTFAGTNATSFTVVNDTTITAVTPVAFESGLAQVDVTTPGGVVYGYYTYSATTASDRTGEPVIRRRSGAGVSPR
jgi:uncharacterized protein (TIGR03437 family)